MQRVDYNRNPSFRSTMEKHGFFFEKGMLNKICHHFLAKYIGIFTVDLKWAKSTAKL